ncbi:MAG TPA: DUF1398 family protein [Bacteroidia bacterium]
MFTLEQIKTAHAKVKSGADFPAYVQELIQMGVEGYETFVMDVHTLYYGKDTFPFRSEPKFTPQHIADKSDKDRFQKELKHHQQGGSDFPTFVKIAAECGIEKWTVAMQEMTCTYYDKAGNEIYAEAIPKP